MVFLFKAALAEEDRQAWRKLARREAERARKKHRAAVRNWLGDKLLALFGIVWGVGGLYVFAVSGENLAKRIFYGFGSLLFLLFGILAFSWDAYPPKRLAHLPGKDFPPSATLDAPIRAVFFGDGCFTVWEGRERMRLGYQTITAVWEDEGRFYLFFQDHPPLILPKRGLRRWMPEDFRDFVRIIVDRRQDGFRFSLE